MASGQGIVKTVLLATLLTILLPPATGQGPAFGGRAYHLEESLVVPENETLVIGPGTVLTGPGDVRVLGRLEVRGHRDDPPQLGVPIRLIGPGPHSIIAARVVGVNGTAITLHNGTLRLDQVRFEGNVLGLDLAGDVRAAGTDVDFRGHSDAGLRVGPLAEADLAGAILEDNAVGIRVSPQGMLRLTGARALSNGAHVMAEVAPPAASGPRVVLLDADLGPTASGGVIGLRLQAAGNGNATAPGNATQPSVASAPGVLLSGGRVHGSPVGIQATGAGLRVRMERMSIDENVVGVSVVDASVELKDVRLGNARDVDDSGASEVRFDNVTRLDAATETAVDPGTPPAPSWAPWAAMAGVAAVAGVILWSSFRPRRHAAPARKPHDAPPAAPPASAAGPIPAPRSTAPSFRPAPPPGTTPTGGSARAEASTDEDAEADAGPATPDPSAAPAPPAAAESLGPQERRILEDLVAHPDAAQAAVAERLGLTRQAVHYHVKKLEARGLLAKTQVGRESRCRVTPTGEAALARPRQ